VTQLVTSGAGTAYSYIVFAGLVSLNHYFSVYIIDCRFVPFPLVMILLVFLRIRASDCLSLLSYSIPCTPHKQILSDAPNNGHIVPYIFIACKPVLMITISITTN
jgi:hypothetical protein